MRVFLWPWSLALCLGSLCNLAHAQAPGGGTVVERIVAVVNDSPVYLTELRRRSRPFMKQVMDATTVEQRSARMVQLYQRLLESLVNETLIEQQAQQLDIRVSQEELDRALARLQRQNGKSKADFWKTMKQEGYTRSSILSDLRSQLRRYQVLNKLVGGRINITEQQVKKRYDELKNRVQPRTCQALQMLVVRLENVDKEQNNTNPGDRSDGDRGPEPDESQWKRARRSAEQLKQTLEDAAKGQTAPAPLNPDLIDPQQVALDGKVQAMRGAGALDLGRVCEGDLDPAFESDISAADVGHIVGPLRGPVGYYLFLVRERTTEGRIPPFEKVRGQIQQQLVERAMRGQEESLLKELRAKADIKKRL